MKKYLKVVGIVIVIIILFLVYHFIFAPVGFILVGQSMAPTYPAGSKLIADKDIATIGRGSVIIFSYAAPTGVQTELIKRIVGLPGESISIKDGKLFVNGTIMDVAPISLITDIDYSQTKKIATNLTSIVLGPDEYFVLGDNTSLSLDSRSFGPIKKNSIRGVVTRSI